MCTGSHYCQRKLQNELRLSSDTHFKITNNAKMPLVSLTLTPLAS